MMKANYNSLQLPERWAWIEVEDISNELQYGSSEKASADSSGIPIIRMGNIQDGKIIYDNLKYLPLNSKDIDDLLLEDGDVLFNRTNSPELVGKTAVYKRTDPKAIFASYLIRIKVKRNSYDPKFLSLFINSIYGREFIKSVVSQQVGQANVNGTKLASMPIPLISLSEQHRIIAKIDELSSRLDAGVEALQKAKAQLKRYRQAVLKAAVEGRLTEEWRKVHPEVEPAERLLDLIKQKQHNKKKSNCIQDYDLLSLPKLPVTWNWTRIGDISERIQYGTSEKAGDNPNWTPILRMGNIQNGKLTFNNLKYIQESIPDFEKFLLRDGDILFNRTNSAELVGKCAVYKCYHPKSIFASYLIRITLDSNIYNPDFLSYFINSSHGRKYIASVVSQQVGQANVNGTKLSLMPIPLATIQEQVEAVEAVERNISRSSEAEMIIDKGLIKVEHLRQSILQRAFEGKLVPQDPNDEPASVLLERINAERARKHPASKIAPKAGRQKMSNNPCSRDSLAH